MSKTVYCVTWEAYGKVYLLENLDTNHLYNITRLVYNYAALRYEFEKVPGGKLNPYTKFQELIDESVIKNPKMFETWLHYQIKKLPSFITELNIRKVDDEFLLSLSLNDEVILFDTFYTFTRKLEKTLINNMHRLPFSIPLSTSCTLSTQAINISPEERYNYGVLGKEMDRSKLVIIR